MEHFNNEAANVRNLEDKARFFWMKYTPRKESLFQVDIEVNKPRDFGDFLRRLHKYMEYEEDDMAYRVAAKNGTGRKTDSETGSMSISFRIPPGKRFSQNVQTQSLETSKSRSLCC